MCFKGHRRKQSRSI